MTRKPGSALFDAEQVLHQARYAVPTRRPGHVARDRLRAALVDGTGRSLVLVSAPAGTGKTTVAAEWARDEIAAGATCGWLTLEDHTSGFWADFVECLSRLGLQLPEGVVRAAQTPLLGRESLTALASALLAPGHVITVVVDDFELDRLDLAREIDFLLRHTFGQLRLVMVTRVDPVLPLYRYRLAEMMVEVRVADLAFSDEEASELLRNHGVELPGGVVHELNECVSGWAAGLRFVAPTLVTVPDPTEALSVILSQVHDINEYLVGEVLDAQGAAAREVMLTVSVPDLILPGLAEELAGPAAPRILADLAHGGAFVEQVQDQPGCYRYYPFFRELLRSQLAYEDPAALVRGHLVSARWFERRGLLDHAVEHLAAAGAWPDVAACVVERGLVAELLAGGASGRLTRLGLRVPDDTPGDAAALVRGAAALAVGDSRRCATELDRIGSTSEEASTGSVARGAAVVAAVRSAFSDDEATASRVTLRAARVLRSTGGGAATGDEAGLMALLNLARGVADVRAGNLAAGTRALGTAARSPLSKKLPQFMATCRAYRALAEVNRGNSAQARIEAMHSLSATIRMGQPTAPSHAVALTALARVKLDQDPAAARRLLQPALESPTLRDDPVAADVVQVVAAGIERRDEAGEAVAGHPGTALVGTARGTRSRATHVLPNQRPPDTADVPGWGEAVPDIVEELTPKEFEVLRLLAELLTTEEIAEKMFVSVNTVRTHIRSILRKLGVNRRNAAIRKARRMHLLVD